MVVTSTLHMGDIVNSLGSGKKFGCEFTCKVQEEARGARVLLKEVTDPQRYGIAALDEKQVISIEEKPEVPKSRFAVVGCYMYDCNVYDYINQISPSGRGEFEISEVNNIYIERKEMEFSFVKGRWTDAGTFDSLLEANQLLLSNKNRIVYDRELEY
ncbi:MAG: sugar phosphate nucleotidyltransferase [Vulcanimicrobiota bacterium]